MSSLHVIILCLSAALICASLRSAHPQIAAAVALTAGVAALMFTMEDISLMSSSLRTLEEYGKDSGIKQTYLLKICGIAMIAEFASDICRDAGEGALARRIDMCVKIGIVASSLPALAGILERIAGLLE